VCLACVRAQDPLPLAEKVLVKLFENVKNGNFFDGSSMFYSTAVIFDGVYELMDTFPTLSNWSTFSDNLLDPYCSTVGFDCYKIVHGENIPWNSALGDNVGLFPVVFLDRMLYRQAHPGTPYSNTTDIMVATWVANNWIEKWPIRLPDGAYSRNSGWPGQKGTASFLWSDDQFMGNTLLNRMARIFDAPAYAQVTANQQLLLGNYMQAENGLFWHGYNHADLTTSCCKWGRANGWVMMSHVEALLALDALRKAHPVLQPDFLKVLKLFQSHAHGALAWQDANSGMWHQVVDVTSTYLESSVTGMLLYSFVTGVKNGWLEASVFNPVIENAWKGIAGRIQPDGTILSICEGTGVMSNVADYEARGTAYTNSGPGLGGVLRAIAAYGSFKKL